MGYRSLAKDEEDRLDRYPPTVRYLQKLGPGELPLILESSKWILEEDPKMGLQVRPQRLVQADD